MLSRLELSHTDIGLRNEGLTLARVLLGDRSASEVVPPRLRGQLENGIAYELVRYGPVADPDVLAEAAKRAIRAHELTSEDPSSGDTLALVRIRQGRSDVAEVMARDLVEKASSDHLQAIYKTTRALALIHLNRFAEARALVDEAASVRGSNPLLEEVQAALAGLTGP